MVDLNSEKYNNIVDFSTRLDDHLARAAPLSDRDTVADRSVFARGAYAGFGLGPRSEKGPTLFDFRLHALNGRDKQIMQIFGFSVVMTGLLIGVAFALTTAMVQISKLF